MAAPVRLTQAQFASQVAGLPTVVEDFEGFPPGFSPNPLPLANGSFISPFPVVIDGAIFCGPGTQCLVNAAADSAPRTFSAFPSRTAYWGTDLRALSFDDVFEVTVTGNSGTSVFNGTGFDSFWGFSDASGLLSVSFVNFGNAGGSGNYSFDNVTTAAVAAVPEPASWALVGLALASVGSTRRLAGRRRVSSSSRGTRHR